MACRFSHQYTEVRFASFLSGGFPTMAVINPPERKLAKRISVQYLANFVYQTVSVCSYFLCLGGGVCVQSRATARIRK